MSMNRKATLALAAWLLAACGGGGEDPSHAQLRLVNASFGYAQLELQVDDQVRQSQVAYGAAEGYIEVDPDKTKVTIGSGASAMPLVSFTPELSKKKHYTLLAYGPAGALRHALLDDNAGAPDTGRTLLRVLNAAADAGPLDVYLTGASESADNAVAVQSALTYGGAANASVVNSGTWRLQVSAAGARKDVRLDLPALVLPSRGVYTLVLTPAAGGVLVNALVLAQQGGITRRDVLHARVRLAAAVTNSTVVDAQVGSTTLAAAVGSPALGDYQRVPAGASALVVRLNGQALPASDVTLAAGRDYTLMVHGLPAAPRATWLDDDNRLPSDSTRVKLRLVNGLADTNAPLAMTLDVRPIASNVAQGTASAYALVDSTSGGNTDGKLSITATGVGTPIFTATDLALRANANYSVFLMGPQAAPVGVVRRDR